MVSHVRYALAAMLRRAALVFALSSLSALSALSATACSSSIGDATPDDGGGETAPSDDARTGSDSGSTTDAGDAPSDAIGDATDPCSVSLVGCDAAHLFFAKIRAYYDAHGGKAQLGDVHDNGGSVYVHVWGAGKVQDFDGGALGPTILALSDSTADWAKSAYAVRGAIRDAYLAAGGGPAVGFPMEDEHPGPGGQVQKFEKGCIGFDGHAYAVLSACDAVGDMNATIAKIGTDATSFAWGTQVAIAVEWLPTGDRWAFNGDQRHVSASSMKFVWAMAALSKNDIPTVTTPALPTFEKSDNSAAGQLIDLAGGPNAVNDFTSKMLKIPVDQLSLCHWSVDKTRDGTATCSLAMGGDNFFTPSSVLDFLRHAWKRDVVAGDKGDTLLHWATLSPRSGSGGWMGTQLPADPQSTMHHKAGWLPPGCCRSDSSYNNMNEIAIVHTPRGPYSVALLFAHATDYWGAQEHALEWASCVVYHAMSKDVADPFSAGCTH